MSEQSFNRKVSRLNANILYLCYTQNVPLAKLSLKHTLKNVQMLLNTDTSDLGRLGAVELPPNNHSLMHSITANESQMADDDDSETDGKSISGSGNIEKYNNKSIVRLRTDENSFPNEWEAIPHLSPMDAQVAAPQASILALNQQTVSIAGGLVNNAVNSVTSIWRGFTGR